MSSSRKKRSPMVRLLRMLMGTVAVGLIVYGLYSVPYDILREERYRLFGEVRTTGLITAVRAEAATQNGSRFFIDYKYIDQDGLARQASAPLPHGIWKSYGPGSRVEVLFVRSKPALSRVPEEIEPAFQTWLRRMLD